ncbi:MAG: hypothetical protein M3N53_06250 [Actinomycetota bacterium]|nr:hypothetical protein [Actinomycetota bacterium]
MPRTAASASADASYVEEINHYAHDVCLEERDERNRRIDQLRAGIAGGSIYLIPDAVRQAVLDRIKRSGFSRRCPCLYDPDYGFRDTSRTRTPLTKPMLTTTSATA